MNKKGRRWYWVTLLLAVAFAVFYLEQRDLPGRYLNQQHEIGLLNEQREGLRKLENERDRVRRRVENLNTDPLEIEAAIRSRKRLVREGEVVYRLEETPAEETARP